jgi:iron-sulfur cluster assembly protein
MFEKAAHMLTLTPNAIAAVGRFVRGSEDTVAGLRISVTGGGCSGMQYGMALEEIAKPSDVVVDFGEVKVFVDPLSAELLAGATVDYVESVDGTGFKFENPNATKSCACGKSFAA